MRFGVAVADITPESRMPMAGYAERKDCFDRVNDPLTFTAVVLEEGDRRALIGAVDLVSMPRDGSLPALLERLGGIVGCPPDCVMLNASHTHGGPSLPSSGHHYRQMPDREACERYGALVYERVADAAREAVGRMQEGSLWFGEGRTALPISRRLERDGRIHHAPAPGAPTDNRIHVLALRDAQDRLAAVGLKVSCHSVATAWQHLITADYPGAWRVEFSRAFGPDVTPFFLQGAGADTRPRQAADGERWRAIPHADLAEIGRELLADCLSVLTSPTLERVADLKLLGKIQPVELPCDRLYTRREQFKELLASGDRRHQTYAEECLQILDEGQEIPDHAPLHVQTLWLNSELALVGLDVEPLCELGFAVEAAMAPKRTILLGYVNGSFCYLPTSTEIARGGYESESFLGKPWTGPIAAGIEERIAGALLKP